jgi:hypothetical protein
MAAKVNLDALIPREDFEVLENVGQTVSRRKDTLSVNDVKIGEFFFSALRKPDFQRTTNEWSPDTVVKLVESFLAGDLIPSIILWRSTGGPFFVIDGSHRISALAAWVNDDYGDGDISRQFYDTEIPQDQIRIAERTRTLMKRRVGLFKHYQAALLEPQKYSKLIERALSLGALAIQLQWVEGDARKAEQSFFRINQQGAPIDSTELRILQARKKPHAVAARAIIRSGKGHKYWSEFSDVNQQKIQEAASEIHNILFKPPLTSSTVKTLDLPIGGKTYSAQTLPLIFDFISIVNPPPGDGKVENDPDGSSTISYLAKCKKVAQRINSAHPASLGLHPAVYFYSQTGRHKPASFHAFTSLILEFEKRDYFKKFIKVREPFEQFLVEYDYFNQQIVRKFRSAGAGFEHIKDFYLAVISKLLEGKGTEAALDDALREPKFSYLIKAPEEVEPTGKDFSSATKSKVFLREALSVAPKCKICGGYIHTNAIQIDHVTRKADGGIGRADNAQLAHPYCNTTVKH